MRTLVAMPGILIGYARCSTDKHDLTAQRNALRELGVDESMPSVAPPSKRSAGVASASPRDGVVRAARNRWIPAAVNMPPNAAAGHADSPPTQRAPGLSVDAASA